MAHIRKHRRKWQAIVKRKKIRVQKYFLRKLDASKWTYKIEAQIETGTYLTLKKQERLNEIKLSELLNFMKDKKLFNSEKINQWHSILKKINYL